jgi:cell division GTPase FtsZ
MPAISVTEVEEEKTSSKKEEVVDDLLEVEIQNLKVENSKLEKLNNLRAKNKMENKMVKKEVSWRLGICGTGQAGSRIAEAFYKLDYDSVCINTALQDLKFINIPDSNKLLLKQNFGGCAKELSLGHAAAENNREEIIELVGNKLQNSNINILATSLGGGSGAGSVEVLIDILSDLGKPLIVMCVLPMDSEDLQTKSNSLETLSKLTKLTQSKKINNLMIVDNSKLESLYQNISQIDFYDVANKAIVEPINTFNLLSAMPSPVKALDGAEFLKLLVDGEGCSVYGELSVDNYQEDTAIAEAVLNNLSNNLLAEGFDLTQSKYVGFVVTANKNTWASIPSSSFNYASAIVGDVCGSPKGIFKAAYVVDGMKDDLVKVYSFFSGLSLPMSRLEDLKKDVEQNLLTVKNKDEKRTTNMKLDTGTHETVSAAQKVKDKIAQKSSAFGKLMGGNLVIDRRNK